MSDAVTVSGDGLARHVAGMIFKRDATAQRMGMELLEAREGYAEVSMLLRDDMMSGFGSAHGGAIFTLADAAFAYACNSRNEMNVALQCSISFHSAGKAGERLIAVAQERSRTDRTGVYDVDVSTAQGRLVALFRGVPYRLNRSST